MAKLLLVYLWMLPIAMAQSFSIGVMLYINGFMDVTFSHNDLIGRQQVDFQVHVYSYMAIESTSITAVIPTKFCSVLKTMSWVAQWGQSRLSMISFCSAICIVIDYFTKMSFTPVFFHIHFLNVFQVIGFFMTVGGNILLFCTEC